MKAEGHANVRKWSRKDFKEAEQALHQPDIQLTNMRDKKQMIAILRNVEDQVKDAYRIALDQARPLQASDLKAQNYDLFFVKRLRKFDVQTLIEAGYMLEEFREAGYKAKEFKCAGLRASDVLIAGYRKEELQDCGFSLHELKDAGFSAHDMRCAGFDIMKLHEAGIPPEDIFAANFTQDERRRLMAKLQANMTGLGEQAESFAKYKLAALTAELSCAQELAQDLLVENTVLKQENASGKQVIVKAQEMLEEARFQAESTGGIATTNWAFAANVEVQNACGDSALHMAAIWGDRDLVLDLVGKVPVNVRNQWQSTALHLAAERGHFAVVEALVVAKADMCAIDNGRETPLNLATKRGHQQVIRLLGPRTLQQQEKMKVLECSRSEMTDARDSNWWEPARDAADDYTARISRIQSPPESAKVIGRCRC